MAESHSFISATLAELSRRKVTRTVGAYAVGVFVLLQLMDAAVAPLRLPDWVPTLVVILVILGFPLVFLLAWHLELTTTGVHKAKAAGLVSKSQSAFLFSIMLLAMFGLAFVFYQYYSEVFETGSAPQVVEQREHGMMGSYAIVGAHLCIANGTAWSALIRDTEQVTVAFFGDGTTNIGAFHEALNFAVVWKLPIIFVCENNLYMEYTPIDLVTAVRHPAADRASAYGLKRRLVDGNDADAVFAMAAEAVATARYGDGPSLIEAVTYRHGGHSRADPGKYRPEEEVEAWLERDPIPMYHQRLLRLGVDEGELVGIEQEVAQQVDDATEFAKASAPPGEDALFTQVWADGGSAWRN